MFTYLAMYLPFLATWIYSVSFPAFDAGHAGFWDYAGVLSAHLILALALVFYGATYINIGTHIRLSWRLVPPEPAYAKQSTLVALGSIAMYVGGAAYLIYPALTAFSVDKLPKLGLAVSMLNVALMLGLGVLVNVVYRVRSTKASASALA